MFFEINVLKEVRILYKLSPQQHYDAANTKGQQQSLFFLNLLIVFFLLFQFVNVPHFPLQMKLLKLKSSRAL